MVRIMTGFRRLLDLAFIMTLMLGTGAGIARPLYFYRTTEDGAVALREYSSLLGNALGHETGSLVLKVIHYHSSTVSKASARYSQKWLETLSSSPRERLEVEYGTSDIEVVKKSLENRCLCSWHYVRVYWWPQGFTIDTGFPTECGKDRNLLATSAKPDDALRSAVYFLEPKPFGIRLVFAEGEEEAELIPPDTWSPRALCPAPVLGAFYEPIEREILRFEKLKAEGKTDAALGRYTIRELGNGLGEYTYSVKDGSTTITRVVFRGELTQPHQILVQWRRTGDRWYAHYSDDNARLPDVVKLIMYDDPTGMTPFDEEKAERVEYSLVRPEMWGGRSALGFLQLVNYDPRKLVELIKAKGITVRLARSDSYGNQLRKDQQAYLREVVQLLGLEITP